MHHCLCTGCLQTLDDSADFAGVVFFVLHNRLAACCVVSGERIGKLIRNAEKAKTPVMCVVGEKEACSNQLSVRTYGEDGDRGVMAVSDVITRIQDAGKTRMPF